MNEFPKGIDIEIDHSRYVETGLGTGLRRFARGKSHYNHIHQKGGKTEVAIICGDKVVARGVATCSMQDQFCYKTGRELALERALSLDNLDIGGVKYYHHRVWPVVDGVIQKKPLPKGGATVCIIFVGYRRFAGTAVCSESDNYSKKTGRELALFRAKMALLANVPEVSPFIGNHKDIRDERGAA